jgi:hypothetical protein
MYLLYIIFMIQVFKVLVKESLEVVFWDDVYILWLCLGYHSALLFTPNVGEAFGLSRVEVIIKIIDPVMGLWKS